METRKGPAAPQSGDTTDPEIVELLKFDPAPRKVKQPNGWTPALQRRFIARLAELGSPAKAADALGRCRFGAEKLYKSEGADSFRAAWERALEIAEEREAARREAERSKWAGFRPPGGFDKRMGTKGLTEFGPLPGQVLNEHGEYEDEGSYRQRGEDAKDSIRGKLLRARRLFLQEISGCPGKRAAFEILTELPIDWEVAKRGEAQPDEPWRKVNQREPDMILTAESGWMLGDRGFGPDKKAKLMRMIDRWRVKNGKEPVRWDGE